MTISQVTTDIAPDMGKVLLVLENLFSDRTKIVFHQKIGGLNSRIEDGLITVDYIIEHGSDKLVAALGQNCNILTDEQVYKIVGLGSPKVPTVDIFHNILYNYCLSSEAVHRIVVYAFEHHLGDTVRGATHHRNVSPETLEYMFNHAPKMFINGLVSNNCTPQHVLHQIALNDSLDYNNIEELIRNRNIGSDTLEFLYDKHPNRVKDIAHSWNNSSEMLEKLYFNHGVDIKNIVCSKSNAPTVVFEDAYKERYEFCLRNMAVNKGTPLHVLQGMVANCGPSVAGRAVKMLSEIEHPDFPEEWVEEFYGVKILPKDNHWWY